MEPGSLYIVATPIGNLGDMTQRASDILKLVDYVLAEDTRVTLKLTNHLGLKKRMFAYTDHASEAQEEKIIQELQSGKNIALVSDAGTPCISDPGAQLLKKVLAEDIEVIPVSGPSSVSTLISVFGAPSLSYHFWGFFPIKRKKQRDLMDRIDSIPGIHVFFESPYRILKTLDKFFLTKDNYHMVIGREMTKLHETYYRGTPKEVLDQLGRDKVKGEFCVGVMKGEK